MRWFDAPEGKDVPLRRFTDRAIWGVVLAFIVLAGTYSVVTPLFEAPDEIWHYPYVKHLADGHGLPVLDPSAPGLWHQEGGQPPLYYALAALATRWVPSDDLPQLLHLNPHLETPNKLVHTARERMPYRGAVLAIHLVRALSVALGALTVLFTYGIGLQVAPQRPVLALAAAAMAAFTPTFLFLSGAVTNDTLIILLATVALWYMLRLIDRAPTLRRWALLGGLLGLAGLTKISGLALFAPAGLTLAWIAWRRREWRLFILGGTCLVGVAALVAGWWYYRNWRLYHDPFAWGPFLAIIGRRDSRPTLPQLLPEWPNFLRSYWGAFGWADIIGPDWFYRLLYGLAALGTAGLGLEIARRLWRRSRPTPEMAFSVALLTAWPLIVMLGLIRWTMLTYASYGRLLFPAISAISFLLVVGLASWLPRRWGDLPVLLGPALSMALCIWVPFGVIKPAYTPPKPLTQAEEAVLPNRLDLILGEQMQLLGCQVGRTEVRPGQQLEVTLYWRALAAMSDDYSVFVHLVDENGLIITQCDVYPGRGLLATSVWKPGDAIADSYTLRIPETTYTPAQGHIVVGLYQLKTGQRLPVRDAAGRALGDSISIGQVLVRSEAKDGVPNPLNVNLANKIALVGYDVDRKALHPGETLRLTLYWKALRPLAKNYTVFAHVLGPNNSIWAQKDAWPKDGAAPTSTWRVGQVVADQYDLVVKPETPAGVYDLEVGIYDGETMDRLSVIGTDGNPGDNRVLLNRIRVVGP